MAGAMELDAYVDMARVEARHWWFRGRRAVLAATIRRLDPQARRENPRTWVRHRRQSRNAVRVRRRHGCGNARSGPRAGESHEWRRRYPCRTSARWANLTERYDLIGLFDVLEHIDDDAAALIALRQHLAPGGRAVITVPAYAALFGPHDLTLHHKRRYEKAELRAKLRRAGLRVQKLTFINAALLPAAVAARVVERWLRRSRAIGTGVPPAPFNAVLAWLFAAEAHLLRYMNLPCGLSLLAVVTVAE